MKTCKLPQKRVLGWKVFLTGVRERVGAQHWLFNSSKLTPLSGQWGAPRTDAQSRRSMQAAPSCFPQSWACVGTGQAAGET